MNVGVDLIEAYVPLLEIPGLADRPGVIRIELIRGPQALPQSPAAGRPGDEPSGS